MVDRVGQLSGSEVKSVSSSLRDAQIWKAGGERARETEEGFMHAVSSFVAAVQALADAGKWCTVDLRHADTTRSPPTPACCVLRTEHVFVCCCCAGSDRVAGMREVQALDLLRDDGTPEPCPSCSGEGLQDLKGLERARGRSWSGRDDGWLKKKEGGWDTHRSE